MTVFICLKCSLESLQIIILSSHISICPEMAALLYKQEQYIHFSSILSQYFTCSEIVVLIDINLNPKH
jgi:hypothetical protein